MGRSLTGPYRDTRVRRPDFPLAEAIGWYLADKAADVQPTTLATYRSHLQGFHEWLPKDRRILAAVEPESVERYVRQTAKAQNTRMNKTVALKSFATYLARKRIWYAGSDEVRVSALKDVRQPRPSDRGLPAYTDAEVRAILRAVDQGKNRLRSVAVIAVLLHGFRAKEVRSLTLRNVVMARYRESGHFIIDDEEKTKRGTHGVREVPMEQAAQDAIREYLHRGRPEYKGEGDEPLFLTEAGLPLTRDGWNAMAQRLRRLIKAETGIPFKQHRLRATSVRQKHEAGWPDSANMEVHGWGANGWKMLRRYRGTIPVAQLKRYPRALDQALGRVS